MKGEEKVWEIVGRVGVSALPTDSLSMFRWILHFLQICNIDEKSEKYKYISVMRSQVVTWRCSPRDICVSLVCKSAANCEGKCVYTNILSGKSGYTISVLNASSTLRPGMFYDANLAGYRKLYDGFVTWLARALTRTDIRCFNEVQEARFHRTRGTGERVSIV